MNQQHVSSSQSFVSLVMFDEIGALCSDPLSLNAPDNVEPVPCAFGDSLEYCIAPRTPQDEEEDDWEDAEDDDSDEEDDEWDDEEDEDYDDEEDDDWDEDEEDEDYDEEDDEDWEDDEEDEEED